MVIGYTFSLKKPLPPCCSLLIKNKKTRRRILRTLKPNDRLISGLRMMMRFLAWAVTNDEIVLRIVVMGYALVDGVCWKCVVEGSGGESVESFASYVGSGLVAFALWTILEIFDTIAREKPFKRKLILD